MVVARWNGADHTSSGHPRDAPRFEQIVAAARSRSPAALQQLYTALAPAVARYLRGRGATDPEDLTSEVFLAVFSGLGSFSGSEEQFRSWVFTIAHRRLVDDRRRRERLSQRKLGVSEGLTRYDAIGPSAEDEAAAHLGCDQVRRLLAHLSPDQRDVLTLRVLGDLSVDQAAQVLGKTQSAVKALQWRALASLRRLISEGTVIS